MNILIACEESQAVCKAFRKRGHKAYSCDLEPCSGGHPEWHLRMDAIGALDVLSWDMMIAHPPCTRLTNSGVRWLHEPPKNKQPHYPQNWAEMTRQERLNWLWDSMREGAEFYNALRDAPIPRKCIENPIMHKYSRALINIGRRQVVQPWHFGDKAFKATGLELIGLPDLTPTDMLTPPKKGTQEHKEWSEVHRASPGPDRAKTRSKTYPGVADAMAEQWGSLTTKETTNDQT